MTNSDRRTNEQAIAVARGQAELPPFIGEGKTRWQEIHDAYSQAAVALDATGQPEDRTLASDVRGFLDTHPDLNATPEIFAAHHARILAAVRAKRASQRLADNIASYINAVNLKNALGQIETDRGNIHPDGSHFARECLIAFTLWHLDAVSGSHPPHPF